MNFQSSDYSLTISRKHRDGFSLVEVTLAIGLFAFALIPILGLMGHGMVTLRDSVADTTKAGIAKALMREAELTEWTTVQQTITGGDIQSAFFTMDGRRQETSDADTIYRGEIRWQPATSPFGTGGQTLSALAIVEVEHFANEMDNLRLAKLITRQAP